MRYDDDGILEIEQIIFEPAYGFEVEVVGRLVQKQYVGIAEQRLRQQHANLALSVKLAHFHVVIFARNIQLVQKRFRLAFRFPTAEFRKLVFQLGGANAVLFRKFRVRVKSVFFVHDLDKPFMSEHDGAAHRFKIVFILVLRKHAHTFVFIERDVALVRLDLPRKHLQKRGFARAVRADDAVAVAAREPQIDFLE